MTIYLSDRTGASIDQVLDNADSGNIGEVITRTSIDADNLPTGFSFSNSSGINVPGTNSTAVITVRGSSDTSGQIAIEDDGQIYFRKESAASWSSWQELYHTGNTGVTSYGIAVPAAGTVFTNFSNIDSRINIGTGSVSARDCMNFYNPNGLVGSIQTTGSATAFNTSSDPRLKDFKELPNDELINTEFNTLFDCFRVFNWKTDPEGDLVWGFDAHECVDNTSIGSEGEGPRDLTLGEVYKTTPAVFEDREIQLVYKSGDKIGQPRFDSEGEPIMETVSVEVTAAIEHKVSPAGVDQSKAVPILLAKIEQLERRLSEAGL